MTPDTRTAPARPDGGLPSILAAPGRVLPGRPSFTLRQRVTAWQPSPYRSILAVCVLALGVMVTWSIVQPLRADHD